MTDANKNNQEKELLLDKLKKGEISRREFVEKMLILSAAFSFPMLSGTNSAIAAMGARMRKSKKVSKLYSDDVFSTFLYAGNSSTQTINNGIDLAGSGGMVWTKGRGAFGESHALVDTVRGSDKFLATNNSNAQGTGTQITAFSSNGYALGVVNGWEGNWSGRTYVSWTFRKAAKFFDVVTYTGNGGVNNVAHGLGINPGMIIVKRVDSIGDWVVYHQSVPGNCGFLNYTNPFASAQRFSIVTSTNFTINVSTADVNANGAAYVAYLFAHDASEDGIIHCGSFTTDGSANASVELGWEPQFLMYKASSATSNWFTLNTQSGWSQGGYSSVNPNLNSAENTTSGKYSYPRATGASFVNSGAMTASATYIYVAIRRPNKPPLSGTQVYSARNRTAAFGGTGLVAGVGFSPDALFSSGRVQPNGDKWMIFDRLRGNSLALRSNQTTPEANWVNAVLGLDMDGYRYGADSAVGIFNGSYSGATYVDHFFRRASGFFDIVCYTGTGTVRFVNHNLAVEPQLIIIKGRDLDPSVWAIYPNDPTKYISLSSSNGWVGNSLHWNGAPSRTVFNLGTNSYVNNLNSNYVAYLFATCPGVSKVGSYTGNGASQTINCNFSTSARFILIKRTDSAGDWFVWDSTRGISTGNDPHISINTTVAEVTTDDSVDPDNSGFIVNQVTATNINVTGATYIFLAIS